MVLFTVLILYVAVLPKESRQGAWLDGLGYCVDTICCCAAQGARASTIAMEIFLFCLLSCHPKSQGKQDGCIDPICFDAAQGAKASTMI
jgi:hypothetical protein